MQEDSTLRQTKQIHRDPHWSAPTFFILIGLACIIALFSIFWQKPIREIVSKMMGQKLDEPYTRVYQYDYDYEPRHITWRVGDRVTIQLRNMSTTHWHEMVIGRAYDNTPSAFGPIPTQFAYDFWDGVPVTFSDIHYVDNLVINKAIPTFIGPKPNIATGGDFSPTLQPGGSINMTFTVPNKPGTWQFGCFVQQYMHFMTGMRGTITILPAHT